MTRTTTARVGGMQEIRVPDDNTTEMMRSAARTRDRGSPRHAAGAREHPGSWGRALVTGFFAVLLGGLTTWRLVAARDDLIAPLVFAFGYILTLMLVWAAARQKPGPTRPAQWIAVYDAGLVYCVEGAGQAPALAWDEIEWAEHKVVEAKGRLGKTFRIVHSLTVRPLPNPVRHGSIVLPGGFPRAETIGVFVTDRVRVCRGHS
ncbi:hypothetical protein ACIRP2_12385 [Streptomyces sp. NPDC101194]|uniref:hypothetical protein n=1 Tax=Streptomyces sp. NPDC101194 TaxID=3366127 RepID=UPI00380384A4